MKLIVHTYMYNAYNYFLVAPKIDDIPFDNLKQSLKSYVQIDANAEKGVFVVPTDLAPKKIVFSGTGALVNPDTNIIRLQNHMTKVLSL